MGASINEWKEENRTELIEQNGRVNNFRGNYRILCSIKKTFLGGRNWIIFNGVFWMKNQIIFSIVFNWNRKICKCFCVFYVCQYIERNIETIPFIHQVFNWVLFSQLFISIIKFHRTRIQSPLVLLNVFQSENREWFIFN